MALISLSRDVRGKQEAVSAEATIKPNKEWETNKIIPKQEDDKKKVVTFPTAGKKGRRHDQQTAVS